MVVMAIGRTGATCCAGGSDSAGAGGKESASATKWRSLGTALSDLAMSAIRIEHRHFWQCCSCNARFYG